MPINIVSDSGPLKRNANGKVKADGSAQPDPAMRISAGDPSFNVGELPAVEPATYYNPPVGVVSDPTYPKGKRATA